MVSAHRSYTSPYGDISIHNLGTGTHSSSARGAVTVVAEQYRHVWLPPADLLGNLPADFKIDVDCFVMDDGERRFVPVGGGEAFLHNSFLAGLAIISLQYGLAPEHRGTYCMMHHVFQLVRRMQEHLDREFAFARDLHVRSGARGGDIKRTVLPEYIGLDSNGRGDPWSVAQLTAFGRQAALNAGIRSPKSKTAIHFGLVEAARRRPLVLPDDELPPLMRMALFNVESMEGTLDDELVERVTERLFVAIDKHLGAPLEKFDKWFFPGKGNLLKTLANQPNSPGGKLPIEAVRRAVLELGWQSYGQVAGCLHAFAYWFTRALPEPLSLTERSRFEQMYLSQPHFGGLPLVMLLERGNFIRNVVTELWEAPTDPNLVGVLHRLLQVYAEMIAPRLEADRRFKRQATATGQQGRQVAGFDWHAVQRHAPGDEPQPIDEVGKLLAEIKGFKCRACSGPWTMQLLTAEPDIDHEVLDFQFICSCGQTSESISLSRSEFKRVAKQALDDMPISRVTMQRKSRPPRGSRK